MKNNKITKSNELILAKYNYSIYENRWLSLFFSKINSKEDEFKPYYIISVKSMKSYFKHLLIDNIKTSATTLLSNFIKFKFLEINIGFNKYKIVNFLDKIEYTNEEIKIFINNQMKQYLLSQKSFFTSYYISNILELKSKYAFRLYEISLMYLNQGFKNKKRKINEIKKQIGLSIDKYKSYKDLKKKFEDISTEISKKTNINLFFEFERKHKNKDLSNVNLHFEYKKQSKLINLRHLPVIKEKIKYV